ncbi:hypothetical protein C1S82_28390 [Mycolicibacterium cosmeticum]|uniref:hypothetical protein n=1 Tax=Mycolicibacterium cosmeticum TaxID=258533 RepID=UPI0005669A78|nr:hypothetical protein [Mycolicibacterium cosmeticum]TLH67495.1 hypothetical protein C1S82_28390 [Mycolicibacterium cosmeticum]
MSTAVMFSLIAAALTAVCSVPQFHRALRQTAGLSLSAWLQSFALGLIWAGYGLATQQWVLLISEGAFACGSLAVVSRLLAWRRTAMCTVVCTLLVAGAFAVFGPGPCLVAASLASVITRVAQIWGVLRSRTAAGVSILTWLVLATANFAWAAAGLCSSDNFFVWSAAIGGLASLAVIATCVGVGREPSSLEQTASGGA